jgi:hypothetical protein
LGANVSKKAVSLRLDEELLARVHVVRGDVSFTRFVVRALEAALSETEELPEGEQAGPGSVGSEEPVRPAAPPRTSVETAVRASDSFRVGDPSETVLGPSTQEGGAQTGGSEGQGSRSQQFRRATQRW